MACPPPDTARTRLFHDGSRIHDQAVEILMQARAQVDARQSPSVYGVVAVWLVTRPVKGRRVLVKAEV